jgi:uncharacterized protein YfkK (UPF0435 family)
MDGYTSKLTKVMFLRIINKIATLPISVVEGDEYSSSHLAWNRNTYKYKQIKERISNNEVRPSCRIYF